MGFSDEDRILMENLYVIKGYGAKKPKGLSNESWGLWRLNKRQDEAAALKKTYRISPVFLFCDIHRQTGYYKKGISHLFANFLSCNTTKYI